MEFIIKSFYGQLLGLARLNQIRMEELIKCFSGQLLGLARAKPDWEGKKFTNQGS